MPFCVPPTDRGAAATRAQFSDSLHDRCLRLSNGWRIVLGRGLDIWQKPPNAGKYFLGASEMALRKTLECDVIYLRETPK